MSEVFNLALSLVAGGAKPKGLQGFCLLGWGSQRGRQRGAWAHSRGLFGGTGMGLTWQSKPSVGCRGLCGLCCLLPTPLKLAVSAGKWGGLCGVPAVRQTKSASAEHFSHLLLGPLVWAGEQGQVRSLALAFCGAP